jgi:hypothetical protein
MDAKRAALAAVATALRPLHKSLIDVTTVAYERTHPKVGGPSALFQLLVHDPYFAWLRPMSGLMADIDEVLDEEEAIEQPQLAELRGRVEQLITAGDHPFAPRYLEILQEEPDVVMAHAALRRALANL